MDGYLNICDEYFRLLSELCFAISEGDNETIDRTILFLVKHYVRLEERCANGEFDGANNYVFDELSGNYEKVLRTLEEFRKYCKK